VKESKREVMIKVVIDIDEEYYEILKHDVKVNHMDYIPCVLIANGTPLDDLRAELGRCKTFHEMQLSERDTKGKLLISDIFCHIIAIIDGYTTDKAEGEDKE